MHRNAALALCAMLLTAGCLGAKVEPDPSPATGPALLPDGLTVHDPTGVLAAAPEGLVPLEASLLDLGAEAFEPTLGVNAAGTLFYAALDGRGPGIGYAPTVLRSRDNGATWEDASPRLPTGHVAPPETNDPYLYVDPATGRVFQFAMAPILVCAVLSWSDDEGDSWTTNPRGCGNTPPWDHQTFVAAAPRGAPTVGYPNVLHQCVNQMLAAWCSRSLDGGFTWSPGTPAFTGRCGGLHGHLVSAPDGTVYLPKDECGEAWVGITRDDGLTWERVKVAEPPTQGWADPAMAIDGAGNVYYAYADENAAILLTVSRDAGKTWSEPIQASPPGLTTHIPAMAAGSDGRIVLAYPATPDLPKGYDSSDKEQDAALWHGYLTLATDALGDAPVFQTIRVNPADDPLVRGPCGPGRCPGMVDFIDVVIGPDGRPYAAFVDACRDACAGPDGKPEDNVDSAAVVATLKAGPSLLAPEADAGEK